MLGDKKVVDRVCRKNNYFLLLFILCSDLLILQQLRDIEIEKLQISICLRKNQAYNILFSRF